MRTRALGIISVLVLVALGAAVLREELAFRQTEVIYLQLARPRNRAAALGDAIAIHWKLPRGVETVIRNDPARAAGRVVVQVDRRSVGSVVRVHASERRLGRREIVLRYEVQGDRVVLGSDAYFIAEGAAGYHRRAVFGELSVRKDGHAILVALCDRGLQRLGPDTAAVPAPGGAGELAPPPGQGER